MATFRRLCEYSINAALPPWVVMWMPAWIIIVATNELVTTPAATAIAQPAKAPKRNNGWIG